MLKPHVLCMPWASENKTKTPWIPILFVLWLHCPPLSASSAWCPAASLLWCGWRARNDCWLLRMSFSPCCCRPWLPLPGMHFFTCLFPLFPILPVLAHSSHAPDKLLWLSSYLVRILLRSYHGCNFILTSRDVFDCHLTRWNVREHRDHGRFCSCLYPRCLAQCLTIKA